MREGELDIGKDLVAALPLLRSTPDIVHDAWRNLPTADGRYESQQALFVAIERQHRFAATIACHAGEQCAVAEDEAPIADHRLGVERPKAREIRKTFSQGIDMVHATLRNSAAEGRVTLSGKFTYVKNTTRTTDLHVPLAAR